MTSGHRPLTRYLIATLLLAIVSLPASALQAAGRTGAEPAAVLEEKILLLVRLAKNSNFSDLIEPLRAANKALRRGDVKSATAQVEQIIDVYADRKAAEATRTDRGEAQHSRYNELSVSIESFRLYVSRALVGTQAPSPLEEAQLQALLDVAAALGKRGHYAAANELLNDAYMLTITAVSILKGGTTIVYSQSFDTPEQEYLYELERYEGLQQLFEMVADEGKLPDRFRWAEKSLQESRKAYENARSHADSTRYREALEHLTLANKELTKVLRLMGLPIS